MALTCCICLEESTDGFACGEGHQQHTACFESYVYAQADKLQDADSLVLRLSKASAREQDFLRGRVRCPCVACDAAAFEDAVVARTVSETCFDAYLESRSRLKSAQRVEVALGSTRQLARVAAGDGGKEGASDSGDSEELAAAAVLAATLHNAFPNARMCGRCFFGPVLNDACDDLMSHHGEVVYDRTTGAPTASRVDNACPRCHWLSPDWDEWPSWDGQPAEVSARMTLGAMVERWREREEERRRARRDEWHDDDYGHEYGDGDYGYEYGDGDYGHEDGHEELDECERCGGWDDGYAMLPACWRCLWRREPGQEEGAVCEAGDGAEVCDFRRWCRACASAPFACDEVCAVCDCDAWSPLSCASCGCRRRTDYDHYGRGYGEEQLCGCQGCECGDDWAAEHTCGCRHMPVCEECDEELAEVRDQVLQAEERASEWPCTLPGGASEWARATEWARVTGLSGLGRPASSSTDSEETWDLAPLTSERELTWRRAEAWLRAVEQRKRAEGLARLLAERRAAADAWEAWWYDGVEEDDGAASRVLGGVDVDVYYKGCDRAVQVVRGRPRRRDKTLDSVARSARQVVSQAHGSKMQQ